MKRRHNFLRVICSLFLATLLLAGCGGSKIQEPDVTAKALYDLYILGDSAEIKKMGMSNTQVEDLRKIEKDSIVNSVTDELKTSGFQLNDEKVSKFADNLMNCLTKLNGTTELVSKDEETATVKISTNHIDLMKIYTEAIDAALADVKGLGLTNETEAQNKYIDLFFDKVNESLVNVQPSDDVVEKTFEFKLRSEESDGVTYKIWLADDMEKFGMELGSMAFGMN